MRATTLPAQSRRKRKVMRLAWSLAGFAVALQALDLVVGYLWAQPMDSVAEAIGVVIVLVGIAAVGAAVASHVASNPLGWLLLGLAVILPVHSLVDSFLAVSESQVRAGRAMLSGTLVGLMLSSILLSVALVLPVTFIPLLFPDGRLPSRRWRVVAWLAVAGIGTFAAAGIVAAVQSPIRALDSDSASAGSPLVDVLAGAGLASAIAAGLLSVASLAVRWRRARSVERQQIKWLIGGIVATLAGFVAEVEPVDVVLMDLWSGLPDFIGDVTGLALPVSIGVAVTRYRLYEIDRLINRTVVYTIVSGLLLVAYLTLVGGLQLVLAPFSTGSQLVVAASTLMVAVAFQPLRREVQRRVDRRFNRTRYDVLHTVDMFKASLHDEVDVAAVTRAFHTVVAKTVQPTHVAVWLMRRPP